MKPLGRFLPWRIPLWHCALGLALLFVFPGCRRQPESAGQDSGTSKSVARESQAKADDKPQRVFRGSSDEPITGPGEDGELSAHGAADLAWRAVTETAEYRSVLVVWILDASPSAQRLVSQVTARLQQHYTNWAERDSDSEELNTAVLMFGDEQPKWLIEEPTSDAAEVVSAFDQTSVISTEVENTFAAVNTAAEHVGKAVNAEQSVMFVVVSDEAGDDMATVDRVVDAVRQSPINVYAIGSPAPFGRNELSTPFAGPQPGISGEQPPTRYGPESRELELVTMDAPFQGGELAVMDSGFGPFGLEYLCRSSGGVFLAIRPQAVQDYVGVIGNIWPSPYARRFPRETMRLYAPDYVSSVEYETLVEQNGAARALAAAAKLERVARLLGPQLEFVKRDEAQFSGELSKAQQLAASLSPDITRIYDVLKEGEADRPQLKGRRWQASYDLAIGQVCVNKARIDGYNAMLARAKRGMNFQNASSTSWLLEAADEHADSNLERLAERGREALEQVVREHPGTPWAALAELELAVPAGWKWTER